MKLPLKLKIVDLKTEKICDGLAVLKPSVWKTGYDIVVLSDNERLNGNNFLSERGFKYAYDFFNLEEYSNSIERVMARIYEYASSRFSILITPNTNQKFKKIKI